MKMMKKIICIVFLITFLLSLCSCDKLDDLKAMRIPLTENGIQFNGKTYKKLVYCTQKQDRHMAGSFNKTYVAAEDDVPLLLIESYGKTIYYNEEQDLFTDNAYYYCSEENYDKYYKTYIHGKLDCYKIDIYDNGEHICYILDSEISSVLYSTSKGSYNELGKNPNGVYEYMTLNKCDESGLVEGKYTSDIVIFKEKTRARYGVVGGNYYHIPSEYQDQIAKLFRDYPEAIINYNPYY